MINLMDVRTYVHAGAGVAKLELEWHFKEPLDLTNLCRRGTAMHQYNYSDERLKAEAVHGLYYGLYGEIRENLLAILHSMEYDNTPDAQFNQMIVINNLVKKLDEPLEKFRIDGGSDQEKHESELRYLYNKQRSRY